MVWCDLDIHAARIQYRFRRQHVMKTSYVSRTLTSSFFHASTLLLHGHNLRHKQALGRVEQDEVCIGLRCKASVYLPVTVDFKAKQVICEKRTWMEARLLDAMWPKCRVRTEAKARVYWRRLRCILALFAWYNKHTRRWSTQTHTHFPAAARARAVNLLLLGHRFSQRFVGMERGVFDIWLSHVIPDVMHRAGCA